MLASLPVGRLPEDGWLFEPKLDGIRCIAMVRDGKTKLLSRRGLDLTGQYPSLAAQLPSTVNDDTILDGEIIALNSSGRPSFQHLQQRMNLTQAADVMRAEKLVPAYFYAFDVLRYRGYDLTSVPLIVRKQILQRVLKQAENVRLIRFFDSDPLLAFQVCVDNGFEGIVGKRCDSFYECGKRSPSWLKLKAQQTAEFVIGGYTSGQGARGNTFGALLLGYYNADGQLSYCGSVGTGFDESLLKEVMRRLEPIKVNTCPFVKRPEDKKDVTWVQPKVVAEIKYMDTTRDGHLRTPVFMRFRDDKVAADVSHPHCQNSPVSEGISYDVVAAPTPAVLQVAEADPPLSVNPNVYDRVLEQLSGTERQLELMVEDAKIKLTNLDKVVWPGYGSSPAVTKREYLRSLCSTAPYLLPHWRDRPITLVRSPQGVAGKSFFQKHWNVSLPEFVDTGAAEDEEGEAHEYLFCNNLASLLFFAQHSALEFHTFSSRCSKNPDPPAESIDVGTEHGVSQILSYPDYLILDLDYHAQSSKVIAPSVDLDAFRRVADVALMLREYLQASSLRPFVKTSGRNGLHVFVPIKRNVDFAVTKELASTIALFLVRTCPELVTVNFEIAKRGGKVYIDCSSNGGGKTVAAPYTPRAVPWAAVSSPIDWGELATVNPVDLSLHSIAGRLAKVGDLWSSILADKKDLHLILNARPTGNTK